MALASLIPVALLAQVVDPRRAPLDPDRGPIMGPPWGYWVVGVLILLALLWWVTSTRHRRRPRDRGL